MQTRHFEIEHTRAADETRTVPVTISSTFPVDRGGYNEVLLHGANNIDLSRAPLSVIESHDCGKVNIGLVEALKTDGTRLRGVMRLGSSERAGELWNDIKLGIVRNLSVGYMIEEVDQASKKDNTVYVTRWTPYETSIVAVSADPQAGIGRSQTFNSEHQKMSTTEIDLAMQGRAAKSANELQLRELTRKNDLRELGDSFKEWGGVEMARRMIESGKDTDAMKRAVLEKMKTVRALPLAGSTDSGWSPFGDSANAQPAWGQGAREILPKPQYFTGPDAEQRAYTSGQWLRALHGNDQAGRWCKDRGIELRAMSPAAISQGGALVPDVLSSTIIDLANSYGAFRQNADVFPMSSDSLGVPRSASDPVASFTGVNATIPESQGDWNLVQLFAKKVATVVKVPTELLEDSVINIADRVAFQLSRSFSKLEDTCGFLGTATSAYGGISGINSLVVDGSHNAAKFTAAATHDLLTEVDASDLAGVVASLPEYALDGAKWFCSGTAFGLVFSRIMQAAGGNTISTLGGTSPLSYAGFPIVVSPVLPNGAATDYTGLPMLLFGNLRLSSKFGSRRDIRIQMLTETYAANDQVGIQATERFDIVNHDLGDNTTPGPMIALIGGA